jgi:undecaprenyl-diphosphatase
MLDFLNHIDTQLFLFLNSLHSSYLDSFMWLISGKWIWLPFYAWLIYLIIKNYGKKSALILLLIAILVVLSDQVSSHLIKNLVERLRPSHEPTLSSQIHLLNNYHGGKYGFVSSHASNSFCIATYFFLLFRKKYVCLPWILFFWAALVSYSRIYLGVHYPGDILGGIITGSGLAIIVYFIQQQLMIPQMRKRENVEINNDV